MGSMWTLNLLNIHKGKLRHHGCFYHEGLLLHVCVGEKHSQCERLRTINVIFPHQTTGDGNVSATFTGTESGSCRSLCFHTHQAVNSDFRMRWATVSLQAGWKCQELGSMICNSKLFFSTNLDSIHLLHLFNAYFDYLHIYRDLNTEMYWQSDRSKEW